jgi:hypothetical protein
MTVNGFKGFTYGFDKLKNRFLISFDIIKKDSADSSRLFAVWAVEIIICPILVLRIIAWIETITNRL